MFFLFLLNSWILAGIMAKESVETHYQKKNSTLCLHVKQPPPYEDSRWTFNKTRIAGKTLHKNYEGKVDINPENLSLCVNNLAASDSGTYKVSFFNINNTESEETHIVIVEDIVPQPVIVTSVQNSNLSTRSCNITVNCSVDHDWVWSLCDKEVCKISHKSLRRFNISISTNNGAVSCNGSNHVSTSSVTENIVMMCFNVSNPEHKEAQPPVHITIILIIIIVVLGAFISCIAIFFYLKWTKHQTSAAPLIQQQADEMQPPPPQSEARFSVSSSTSSEPAYENVETEQPIDTSTLKQEPMLMSSHKVDTVYSILQAPNGSDSIKDMNAQEATTSQSAAVCHIVGVGDIDTVYSVLQKPQNLQQHQQVT